MKKRIAKVFLITVIVSANNSYEKWTHDYEANGNQCKRGIILNLADIFYVNQCG